MMIARYLIAFACGSLLGTTAFVIFQADGYRPGTLGILTMCWLSQMGVCTASQIYVLLCETSIEQKPQRT